MTNEFGKNHAELKAILGWNRLFETNYREVGAFVVNANQVLAAVVDQVLADVGVESRN